MTEIAFLYHDQMRALDSVRPYEVLARLPGANARAPGLISTDVGLNMALTLAAMEAGEEEACALQSLIDDDPQPPFDSGAFEGAATQIRECARAHMVRQPETAA